MKFCEYCGSKLDDNSKFCPMCGAAVKQHNPPVQNKIPETQPDPPVQKAESNLYQEIPQQTEAEPAKEQPVQHNLNEPSFTPQAESNLYQEIPQQPEVEPVKEQPVQHNLNKPSFTPPVSSDPVQESMVFCTNCGAKMPASMKFCPMCGANVSGEINQSSSDDKTTVNNKSSFQQFVSNINDVPDSSSDMDADDIASNKVMAVLSYFGILVLIPIFSAKNSKYARFHANQGLTLAIISIAWWLITVILDSTLGRIGLFGFIISLLSSVGNIAVFVLSVIGIVNAVKGRAKELPVIGKFVFLK